MIKHIFIPALPSDLLFNFLSSEEDLTPEGDVYSFGVVLLEILSGRRALDANRPSGEQDLVQHARSTKKCKLHQLFDEARKTLNLAMKCLSTDSKFRPDLNEVVKLLEQLQSSSEMEDLAARASLKSDLAKFFMPIQAMYGPNRRQKKCQSDQLCNTYLGHPFAAVFDRFHRYIFCCRTQNFII